MSTICISHKKMKELKDKLPDLISDTETQEKVLEFMIEFLRYDDKKTYKYDKEKYEKYDKPYIEKNREKINIQKAESARKRYHQKKLEKSLNEIKINN